MSEIRLNEALGTKNIFTNIMSRHVVPWAEDTTITGALLDFEYMMNQSGDKLISPAVSKSLVNGVMSDNSFNNLCDSVFMMYGKRWARLWEILNLEFDPIQNYNMTEKSETKYGKVDTNSGTDTTLMTGTDTFSKSGTDTLQHTGTDTMQSTGTDTNAKTGNDTLTQTGTDTVAKSGTDTLQHTGTDNTAHTGNTSNQVSGFNSSGYTDNTKDNINTSDNETKNLTDRTTYASSDAETKNLTDKTTYASTNTETKNLTDTETKNLTDRTTYASSDAETRNMSDALTHGHVVTASGKDETELTRSGNIGVTTSQMMAQSSLELWKWNFFYDIFRDVDNVFTIATY